LARAGRRPETHLSPAWRGRAGAPWHLSPAWRARAGAPRPTSAPLGGGWPARR